MDKIIYQKRRLGSGFNQLHHSPQQRVRPLPPLEPLSHLSFPPLLPRVEVSGPKTIKLTLTRFVTKYIFFMSGSRKMMFNKFKNG
jgi:hypothetical protein